MPVRSSQEDLLLRDLRSVAAMLARAMGFRANGDLPAARLEIDEAYSTLLGPQARLLRMLDPHSAAQLIGHSRKLTSLARLTATEAALAGDSGNADIQSQMSARARALAEEAVKLDPTDDEAASFLAELKRQ